VFLAATWSGHISVPRSPDSRAHHESFLDLGQIEFRVVIGDGGSELRPTGRKAEHDLYTSLHDDGHPGLVLFSSGSTGKPKAAVHNLQRLLGKYRVPRQRLRTLVFLLLDHIGGVNTLFYTLSNAGAVVLSRDRSAAAICDAIEAHRVELLPTSPTFLNLLLLSGEAGRRDLSSLKLITYGPNRCRRRRGGRRSARFPRRASCRPTA
jgi:acyl-coenzyme A synthetase/AMP-(fatty) acid ligase